MYTSDQLTQLFQQAADTRYTQVVLPELQGATTDPSNANQAMQDGLAWARQVALAGLDKTQPNSDRITEVFKLILAIYTKTRDNAVKACTSLPGPVYYNAGLGWFTNPVAIQAVLGAERAIQLLGGDDTDSLNDLVAGCRPKGFTWEYDQSGTSPYNCDNVGVCATYKLALSAHICGSQPIGTWTFTWHFENTYKGSTSPENEQFDVALTPDYSFPAAPINGEVRWILPSADAGVQVSVNSLYHASPGLELGSGDADIVGSAPVTNDVSC
jgi:hypothetical protein